jgi:hypothetical protein
MILVSKFAFTYFNNLCRYAKAKQGDAKVNNMPRLGAAAAGGDHASSTLTPLALWWGLTRLSV